MHKTSALAISAALALGLSACGGSKSGDSGAAPHTGSTSTAASSTTTASPSSTSSTGGAPAAAPVSVAADPSGQLKFSKNSLTATAGKVTIRFTNGSPLPHDLTVEQGSSGANLGATPVFQDGTKTLTVDLKPGTYTFFCSVPGHRAAGMHGTLTVH
jgi:plastocyanin